MLHSLFCCYRIFLYALYLVIYQCMISETRRNAASGLRVSLYPNSCISYLLHLYAGFFSDTEVAPGWLKILDLSTDTLPI